VANRVGEENEGWRMITTQLNHERVGLAAWSGFASQLFEEVAEWAASTALPGDERATVLDLAWVQTDLARCEAELEAMYLLNWRMASAVAAGRVDPADSSAVKVFGVERSIDIYRRLLGVVGAGGYLSPRSPGAVLEGRLERAARHAQINTFGGGVNEIQREIVAMAGLGMTRAAR
jgi:3-oxocholest-4-en-26-oyl-CoA dehydrogenase alpha subunit